jgi:acetolactate decarboxylase
MPELNCALSSGLWNHLQEYSERTEQPITHIVSKALAEFFEIPYHTMFQVSTATALVEGIYQGAVRVATLREHGDLGLGTFEGLDGEMVIVDGHFFQVRSDGLVREVDDNVLTPLALITGFAPEPAVTLDQCPDLGHLTSRFDTLRHSDNVFFALRVSVTPGLASMCSCFYSWLSHYVSACITNITTLVPGSVTPAAQKGLNRLAQAAVNQTAS